MEICLTTTTRPIDYHSPHPLALAATSKPRHYMERGPKHSQNKPNFDQETKQTNHCPDLTQPTNPIPRAYMGST